MNSIKIGILLYPTFGGSGVVATELGKALAQMGHEVHFITYSRPFKLGGFQENIYYHEVRVAQYPLFDYAPYELVLSSKIVDIVKYYKLDLLHVHYAIPHASAAYMAKQILKRHGINIPYITTLHGTDITLVGKDASFEPVITFAINESDAVTAVSESLKQDTVKHFKIDTEIEVVPNFICLAEYPKEPMPEVRNHYAPNGEKVISHVSNFRKVKRIPDVIDIFAAIHKEMPSKLLLVGDGPERYAAEELCKSHGICDDVVFLGKLKTTREVLSISDLFLLPSDKESFGLAALEAMACGVPVISTNAGGVPEVVSDGKDGYLCEIGDVPAMAKASLKLLKDEALHAQFREGAFAKAEMYDLDKIVPDYTEIYSKVLKDAK